MVVERRPRTAEEHLAVAQAEIAQLLTAVDSNRTIGLAVGVLSERYQLTPEAAMALLRRISQNANRKVHDLAEDLVTTGEIPLDGTTTADG